MHHRVFVAPGELCDERDCCVVPLSTTRHDPHGFVFCDFIVELLIWIVLSDLVLWISCAIALEGAFSANRTLQPGQLSFRVSGAPFVWMFVDRQFLLDIAG